MGGRAGLPNISKRVFFTTENPANRPRAILPTRKKKVKQDYTTREMPDWLSLHSHKSLQRQFHQPRLLQLHLYPHIRIQIDIRLDTPEHRRPVRVHVLPEAHPMQRASNWNIVLILGSRRTEVETGFNAT